jgi:hypothetical protein
MLDYGQRMYGPDIGHEKVIDWEHPGVQTVYFTVISA